jgi:hypothetical protein
MPKQLLSALRGKNLLQGMLKRCPEKLNDLEKGHKFES